MFNLARSVEACKRQIRLSLDTVETHLTSKQRLIEGILCFLTSLGGCLLKVNDELFGQRGVEDRCFACRYH
jgi:hypothetical protein